MFMLERLRGLKRLKGLKMMIIETRRVSRE
jgi:hypothetical protein